MTSCLISLAAMHLFLVVFLELFFFCFPKTRNLNKGTTKKFKCGRPLKEESCNDEWLVI